jgi:O-antigen/teichoic acid export membrane protein
MQSSSIIKNTSFLFIAHLLGRILTFILLAILPRYLEGGFDDLGKYFAALWLANLLATLMELGIYTPLVREIAADRSKAPEIVSNALLIKLVISVFNFLIIAILAEFMYSGVAAQLLYIIGLSEIAVALSQLIRRVFRAFERMEFEALSLILERFVICCAGLYVVIKGHDISGFALVVLITSILSLFIAFLMMIWKFTGLGFRFLDISLCINLLKQSLPFAFSGVLYAVYFRIDGLMLKHMMKFSGDQAIGWYGTGYNFVTALTIIPGAFMGAIFPVMSRMFKSAQSALDFLYTKSLKLMFIIALPIAVGGAFTADRIVAIIYPPERFAVQDQEALSQILEILIWAGALIFLNFVLITVFRATNKRKAFLMVMSISVSVNILSNLILIPRYAHLGPPVSMIISELIFLICGIWYIHGHVCKLIELGFIPKTVFASAFLTLGLFVWKYAGFNESFNIIIVICLGIVAYLAVIVFMKTISREDIAMVKGNYTGVQIGE